MDSAKVAPPSTIVVGDEVSDERSILHQIETIVLQM